MPDMIHDSTLRDSAIRNSTIVVSANQLSTFLDDEAIVLDLASGTYFGLEQVGARIWTILQQPTTCAQIVDTLAGEYAVDAATLEHDVLAFINELHENRLVDLL